MGSTFGGDAAGAAGLGGGTAGRAVTLGGVGVAEEGMAGNVWVPVGGGLATEESITTTLPGPLLLSGSWVV